MPPNRSSPKSSVTNCRWPRRVTRLLNAVWRGIIRLGQRFATAIRHIRKRDQLLAIILLLIWVVLLLGNFYVRGVSRFEGSLITRSMSFTYAGNVDKRFLNSIDNILKLNLQGEQTQPLVLEGRFSSRDPNLNKKLESLPKLEIQLTSSRSRLTLETADASQTAISLQEMQIFPKTQIAGLTYLAKASQLKLCVQSSQTDCENPSNVNSNQVRIGRLGFSVAQSPLNLFISSAKIPALSVDESILETSLRWTPEVQDFTLPLMSPASLQISLPKASKPAAEETSDDVTRAIRGNILVKDVDFSNLDRTGNTNDDIETSEILDGEVRMMGQSLKLQPGQVLIIPTDHDFDKPNCRMSPTQNPGIQRLRDIRLNTKDPQGLQTLFSGESKCLAIGLYERFPTQSIEPSWLLKYLPQEGINAIYTLIGAFTGILFPRLFPDDEDPKA